MKYLLVVQLYGNLSITTATSEINETVESMSRFLTTNRNIELLEPYEGKLSRTVLRGEGGSNALDLPDVQKQGDFFVESPIILFASIIWYLKIRVNGIAPMRASRVVEVDHIELRLYLVAVRVVQQMVGSM